MQYVYNSCAGHCDADDNDDDISDNSDDVTVIITMTYTNSLKFQQPTVYNYFHRETNIQTNSVYKFKRLHDT